MSVNSANAAIHYVSKSSGPDRNIDGTEHVVTTSGGAERSKFGDNWNDSNTVSLSAVFVPVAVDTMLLQLAAKSLKPSG